MGSLLISTPLSPLWLSDMRDGSREPIDLAPRRKPAQGGRKLFKVARTVSRQFWFRPREAFSLAEIRLNGRIIRNLSSLVRRGPAEPPKVYVDEAQHLDLGATAESHGLDVSALRARVAQRRRQTARMAYLTFGLAWLIIGWWFWQAWTAHWTVGHMIVGLEFIPFAGLFFRKRCGDDGVERLSRLGRELFGSGARVGSGPGPRQQRVHLVRLCSAGDDPLEHVGQPSQRIHAVQLGRLNQRHRQRPVLRPAIRPGE